MELAPALPRCPKCHHPAALRSYVETVAQMQDPPRTADRWQVTVRYQCMWIEDHAGVADVYTTDDLDHDPPWGAADVPRTYLDPSARWLPGQFGANP